MELFRLPDGDHLLELTSFDEIAALRLGLQYLGRPSVLRPHKRHRYDTLNSRVRESCASMNGSDVPAVLPVESSEFTVAKAAFAVLAEALMTEVIDPTSRGTCTTGTEERDTLALAIHDILETSS